MAETTFEARWHVFVYYTHRRSSKFRDGEQAVDVERSRDRVSAVTNILQERYQPILRAALGFQSVHIENISVVPGSLIVTFAVVILAANAAIEGIKNAAESVEWVEGAIRQTLDVLDEYLTVQYPDLGLEAQSVSDAQVTGFHPGGEKRKAGARRRTSSVAVTCAAIALLSAIGSAVFTVQENEELKKAVGETKDQLHDQRLTEQELEGKLNLLVSIVAPRAASEPKPILEDKQTPQKSEAQKH